MIELELYKQLNERLKSLISEATKCKRLSEKVGQMDNSSRAYDKANSKLHYDFAALHRQENRLLEFIKNELPNYVKDEIYAPSSWHNTK